MKDKSSLFQFSIFFKQNTKTLFFRKKQDCSGPHVSDQLATYFINFHNFGPKLTNWVFLESGGTGGSKFSIRANVANVSI